MFETPPFILTQWQHLIFSDTRYKENKNGRIPRYGRQLSLITAYQKLPTESLSTESPPPLV